MPIFSRLPSDAEQTSVTSRRRWCWASPDSVSWLVAGYTCEVLQYYYVTADWHHAWLVTGSMITFVGLSALSSSIFLLLKHLPWLFLKPPSAGPPTQRRPLTSRNWSWSRMTLWRTTAVDAPSLRETTHRHNTSPVTRPHHRVHPAGAAAAVVARNRLHPFKCCRRWRRCRQAAGRSCYSIDVCFAPGL